MKKGKRYQDSAKLVEQANLYDPTEALELVTKTAKAKFDETVEIHLKLGVDGRHADQQVRGAIVLPNGTGKSVRVLAFAKGEQAEAAKAGQVEYRLDKSNIIHCPMGKVSFGVEKLEENFNALVGAIIKAKPAAAKGQYIKSCTVASSMGPGIRVNPAKLTNS